MSQDHLVVRGAREHNLKNISVAIPRNKLTVITGLSGSGKSSLAFDTIYAEGQRRYVESLSAYARQFLGLMEKPDVDAIEGLSPAISIEQKTTGQNPRSTVGTVTEIYDYLRLLWARAGVPHCPNDGTPVTRQSAPQITETVLGWPEETRIEVLAPMVRGRKGEFRELFEDVRKRGFVRVRVDGTTYDLSAVPALNRRQNHDIAVVIDRLVVRAADRGRLNDSIETALKTADGLVEVVRYDREADGRTGGRADGSGPTRETVPSADASARPPSSSPSGSPVPCAASRFPSWSRGSSPSTRRSAPAPIATAWAPGARSTPS
jgi:excinuclease ABC subunit A